jgi:hypothetical protein
VQLRSIFAVLGTPPHDVIAQLLGSHHLPAGAEHATLQRGVPRVATEHATLQRRAACCNVTTQHATLRHGTMQHVPRRFGPVPCRGATACAVATAPSVSLLRRRSNAAAAPLRRVRSVARVRRRPRSRQLLDEPASGAAAAAAPPPFERRFGACDADATALLRLMLQARRAALRCNSPRRLQHAAPRCSAHVCAARAVNDARPSAVPLWTKLHRGVLHCTASCCAALYYVAPRCTVLHREALVLHSPFQCCNGAGRPRAALHRRRGAAPPVPAAAHICA